jgi:N-dimethylarginine dimethylaminohydrolase
MRQMYSLQVQTFHLAFNGPFFLINNVSLAKKGREFFVGLSKRTNIVGAKAVATAFPDYPVALIKVTHLATFVHEILI